MHPRMVDMPEYRSWCGMKARCHGDDPTKSRLYGDRGIYVCERWIHSFRNFLADMGRKPSKHHSVDRIDNNGPYSPENCRWATVREQGANRRTNHIVSLNGKSMTLMEWARLAGTPYNRVQARLRLGWGYERSIFAPSVRIKLTAATSKAREMYAKGASLPEIVRETGVSFSWAYSIQRASRKTTTQASRDYADAILNQGNQ